MMKQSLWYTQFIPLDTGVQDRIYIKLHSRVKYRLVDPEGGSKVLRMYQAKDDGSHLCSQLPGRWSSDHKFRATLVT